MREVRDQVPGTTCNGARTNSAINNSQNSGYVRAPEYYAVHWGSGAPVLRHQALRAVDPVLRRQYRDATCWRHIDIDTLYPLPQCLLLRFLVVDNIGVTSKNCAYRDSNSDCLSRVRRSAGLSITGWDTDSMSCSVFICALRSLYSALKSIILHRAMKIFIWLQNLFLYLKF